jgi:hypothetical protein
MPDPRVVFEHPEQHWDFLTASDDTEFEGQFFDRRDCCVYDVRNLDLQVLQEFRKVFLLDSGYEYSDEELLYQVGQLIEIVMAIILRMLECCFLQRIRNEFYRLLLFGYCDLRLM